LSQPDVYRMISRRGADAGIRTRTGYHTFRATGITEYLRNGGKLEIAQAMANHESARTTGLYDRRENQISLDEVERILIYVQSVTGHGSVEFGELGTTASPMPTNSPL
jgi:integrase